MGITDLSGDMGMVTDTDHPFSADMLITVGEDILIMVMDTDGILHSSMVTLTTHIMDMDGIPITETDITQIITTTIELLTQTAVAQMPITPQAERLIHKQQQLLDHEVMTLIMHVRAELIAAIMWV